MTRAGRPPFIAGAAVTIDADRATTLLAALLDGGGVMSEPVVEIFEAAITEDAERLERLAAEAGVDPARFATAAALAIMPLLQACHRAWRDQIPEDWMEATCPVCGAWATLAEARGLERRLRARCGRCGADWSAEVLRCAFCGNTDHGQLGTLLAEGTGDTRKVDTCGVCRGYMKTIATLAPCAPADVRLLDCATVDLDMAAVSHDFARPARPPVRVDVRVVPRARGVLASLARWRR